MVGFEEISKAPYFSQSLAFLHILWNDGAQHEAVKAWSYSHVFTRFDPKKAEGSALEKESAIQFLTFTCDALSEAEAVELLHRIDLNKNGKLSLIEYLLFRFKKTRVDLESVEIGAEEAVVSEIASKLQEVLRSIHAEAAVNVTTVSVEIANKAYSELVTRTQQPEEDEAAAVVHEPEYLQNAKQALFTAFRNVDEALKQLPTNHEQILHVLAEAEEVLSEVKEVTLNSPVVWWLEHEISIAKEHTK